MRREEKQLFFIFGLIAAFLAFTLVSTYWLGNKITDDTQRIVRLRTLISDLDNTLAIIRAAESGQRGFLLTGNGVYLDPYHAALEQINSDLINLDHWQQQGEITTVQLGQIHQLIDQKRSELQRTIDLAQAGRRDEALWIVKTDYGKKLMDKLQPLIQEIESPKLAQIDALHGQESFDIFMSDAVIVAFCVINVLALIAAFFRIRSEMHKSHRVMREAIDANQAKDRFLAMLSHELRTPLTPALATSVRWDSAHGLPESLRAEVRMLRRNLELEARLIDDLLDISRVASGKLTLNIEVVDIHLKIRQLLEICADEITGKPIHIGLNLNAHRPYAALDPARFQQILWNIIRNGIKFSSPNGELEITTSDEPGGWLEITIADHGIGIEPESIERLFQPFEQGSRETPQKYGGLGLGLAISKKLIEAQGGAIRAHSEGLGKGAAFIIRIPTVEPRSVSESALPHPPRELGGFRLLLVEDHADTAQVLQHILEELGSTVVVAPTIHQARQEFGGDHFDVVLSDISLPDGTGVDLVRWIRQKNGTPCIALTGYGMEQDVRRCLEAGFSAHVTKPFNVNQLVDTIKKVCNAP